MHGSSTYRSRTTFRAAALPRAGIDLAGLSHILVVKPDEIGDWILATPFLRGLRRSAPRAAISLAVAPAAANLAEACPYVDRVVVVERTGDNALRLSASDPAVRAAFLADFHGGRFELAVVPRFDFDRYGAGPLAHASKAPVVAGFSEAVTELKRRRNAGFDRQFYTHVLARPALAHEVEHNLALLEFLGGSPDHDRVEVFTTPADAAEAERRLAAAFPEGGAAPLLAVCPGSSYGAKMLPLPRLFGIAHRVAEALGGRIVVLGGEAERGAGAYVTARLPGRAASLCGVTTLRQSVEVIRRCAGVLSMCSAPAHMAAAVGTPVAEFSCHPASGDPGHFHSPVRFRPWGDPTRILVIQPPAPLHPCKGSCEAPEPHCIGNIPDAAVTESILRLLRAREI